MIGTREDVQPIAESAVERVVGRIVDTASVEAVFGKPVEREGTIIIPCSEVMVTLGIGGGSGPAMSTEQNAQPTGSGSGGGGGARGRPIAVIVMSPEGVRVEPVLDMTKLALAILSTVTFLFVRIARVRRAGKKPSLRRIRRAIEK